MQLKNTELVNPKPTYELLMASVGRRLERLQKQIGKPLEGVDIELCKSHEPGKENYAFAIIRYWNPEPGPAEKIARAMTEMGFDLDKPVCTVSVLDVIQYVLVDLMDVDAELFLMDRALMREFYDYLTEANDIGVDFESVKNELEQSLDLPVNDPDREAHFADPVKGKGLIVLRPLTQEDDGLE